MQDRDEPRTTAEWDEISRELGFAFSAGELRDRWEGFLQPGLVHGPFTVREYRFGLKQLLEGVTDWEKIATRMGTGVDRTGPQVKVAITALRGRLQRYRIQLRNPDDIDGLPDQFFKARVSTKNMAAMSEVFRARVNSAIEQPAQDRSET
jgi:hypothetical protein